MPTKKRKQRLSSPPRPRKKRKLHHQSDEEDIPSNDDIQIIKPIVKKRGFFKTKHKTTTQKNKNKNKISDDDDDDDDYDMDNDIDNSEDSNYSDYDDDHDDENNNNNNTSKTKTKYILTATDNRELTLISNSINSLKATQLKSFLKRLKTLVDRNHNVIFNNCSQKGKKADLIKRINDNVKMIYSKDIKPYKSYTTHEYDRWKASIKKFVLELSNTSKLSFGAKLCAYDKDEIINYLERFFNDANDNGVLRQQFIKSLPSINLEPTLRRHSSLMNAIRRAVPNSRWGSRRDQYCYNRCKPTIKAAKDAIISDGNKLINSYQWGTCLNYLVAATDNLSEFIVWDDEANNKDVVYIKDKLKRMYQKVEQALGFSVSVEQQAKLRQLEVYFNKL